jgi:signal transduction histidine kinase
LRITPIRDEAGEVTHYIGLQRDVTERKRRFQRLSVLDRVLRHNIRNKTNVIAGYAADIETGEATDPKEAARTAREAAMDLLSLAEAAREFHDAMGDDARDVHDVSVLAMEAVEATREAYPGAEIEVEVEPAVAIVTPAVELAVEELLTNAIEHSDRTAPNVAVTVEAEGSRAVVSVADDGPGVPESVLAVIESHGETPTEHLGGLGLWLVRWAVRGVGGELDFEPNEPRGTVVRMRLPLASPVGGAGTDTD